MILDKLKTMLSKKPNHNPAKNIEELDLTVRTYNVLKRQGVDTVGDLVQLSWNDITKMRGSVRKTCEECVRVLEGLGLGLGEDDK